MRKIFTGLIILFSFSLSWAGELQKQIDNFQGEGYHHLSGKRHLKAIESFLKAGELSKKDENWQGCIDAAFGLISLKEITPAYNLIKEAEYLIKFNDDWRNRIVLANAIIALPENRRGVLLPDFYLDKAYGYAKNEDNWFGLLEIAKSYIALKKRPKAEVLLQEALMTVSRRKSATGCTKIAEVYERMDRYEQADHCRVLQKRFAEFRNSKQNVSPPKGWSPNGETIAGHKPLEKRTTPTIINTTDHETQAWIREQDRINRLQQQWINLYEHCYNYPYGYDQNTRRFSHWLDNRNSYYEYRDGIYFRIKID